MKNSSTLIWESLIREGRDTATRSELEEIALRLNKSPRNSIDHLVRSNYLTPLFRGFYSVNDPKEIWLGISKYNHLERFAKAAKVRGLGRWYFGLYTASRLNGLTHEYRPEETVINDRLYRIDGIKVASHRFVIHKWDSRVTKFGVTRKSGLPVSDREKTVLDLAYHDYWSNRKGKPVEGEWRAYLHRVDSAKLHDYLERFPHYFRDWVTPWT